MRQNKIINFIVYLLVVAGIVVFVNFDTDNSLASIYKVFNPCEAGSINNCTDSELQGLINKALNK